jgi:DNA primase
MIPDHQVAEVRDRADIVDIIGEFVSLKKAGKEYKARCPFHDEKTPSFCVVPDKGFYKCFGCGESGDVFRFLMKKNGLDFVEAVRHVAARTGVELQEVQGRAAPEDPNRPLFELNAYARAFYRSCLEDPEGGRHARDYLTARGVDAESAERFGLGYAPDSWRALSDAAKRHGFDEALLLEAGLLSTSERAKEPFDTFRDRVIFPIEDVTGRTVAFGARVLGKGEGGPKYLNSPETPVYHKGQTCYGLSWAKHHIRKESSVLLVEGYMDVVTLAASGVANVVAPLGTSVTDEQAGLLARYTNRVFLLFDSDAAGLKATFRAGDTLLRAGMHPAVVTLPPGEDPDTLVRQQGAAGLRHYLEQAVDVLERKLRMLDEHDYFADIDKTRQALDKLLPTLRAAADPALRDIYVSRVAGRTGVRRETLEAEMLRRSPRPLRTAGGNGAPVTRASRPPVRPARTSVMGAERTLLLLMIKSRDFIERVGEQVGPEDFADPAFRAIFEALLADPELRAAPPAMDPVAAKRLEELLSGSEELAHPGRVLDETLVRLRLEALMRQGEELERLIEGAPDVQERERHTREKIRLSGERNAIGSDWSHLARKLRSLGTDERHR